VGKKKYAYDIWGSTVNIASRMESNGEPGKVNISSATYELVKDYYKCSHRGKISAKNVGEIDMYFIEHEYTIPKSLLLKENIEVTQ
jgi:class 3 adenylate cyclase